MGRLFHVFLPLLMKILVLVLVKGRLLDVTPMWVRMALPAWANACPAEL